MFLLLRQLTNKGHAWKILSKSIRPEFLFRLSLFQLYCTKRKIMRTYRKYKPKINTETEKSQAKLQRQKQKELKFSVEATPYPTIAACFGCCICRIKRWEWGYRSNMAVAFFVPFGCSPRFQILTFRLNRSICACRTMDIRTEVMFRIGRGHSFAYSSLR